MPIHATSKETKDSQKNVNQHVFIRMHDPCTTVSLESPMLMLTMSISHSDQKLLLHKRLRCRQKQAEREITPLVSETVIVPKQLWPVSILFRQAEREQE